MVKVSLSILLSALVLLQGLNLHLRDILELSDLIEHLEMHQSSYGDDLYSFLDKHYGTKKSEHDLQDHRDGGDHDRLPFKDKASCSTISHLVMLPGIDARKVVCDAIPEIPFFHYQENYSFLNQTEIFQPPRTI